MCRHPVPPSAQGDSEAANTLLVVEDDLQLQELLRLALNGAGFHVITANDGYEALDVLEQHGPGHQPVDLVMLDLHMPRMDGRECLRRLAGQNRRVPVLVMSGDAEEQLTDLPGPVEGVLRKPVGLGSLLETVRRALEHAPSPADGPALDQACHA